MRGFLLDLLILMFSVCLYSLEETRGVINEGFKVISENETEVIIEFALPEYQIEKLKTDKATYNIITTNTQAYTTEVGMPYLPIFGTGIAVPRVGKVSWKIIDSDYTEFSTGNIFPSQKEGFVYDNITLEENEYNGFFPANTTTSGDNFILRDYRVKPLQIKPFQYDKSNKKLRIFNKITLKISTDKHEEGYNELYSTSEQSSAFDKVYQATILNYHRDDNFTPNTNILFIHRDNGDPIFQLKLDQYIKYKKQKGFNVLSVSTSDIGSTTASGIKNYIQNLYNGDTFKLDYVVLVGDVTGSFGIPTFNEYYAENAEGDYPYTHLAGNDLVGDIFIGRMSINNSSDLSRYVGKIKSYERISNPVNDPYLDNMLLVADTDPSGESTVNHCKFVKQISQRVNPDNNYYELYANEPNANEMNSAINDGVGFFIYRGIYGMSGWNAGNGQSNNHKLNHACMITCGTGDFAANATTEDFVNQGSETSPKGGITAIGMATTSTHTSYNNSLSGGIFHGIYNIGQRTMGQALLTGKITNYIIYSESAMSDVKKFTHWCNLIGDPTVDVYVGEANKFIVERSDFLPDTEELTVLVEDSNYYPVGNTSVTLSMQDGSIYKAITNDNGLAIIQIESGNIQSTLTVNKDDFFPYQNSITSENNGDMRITDLFIDDDTSGSSSGNSNQNIEAGETIELNFVINNLRDYELNNIQATLSINDLDIEILEANREISSLAANSCSMFNENFLIHINNNILNNTNIAFILDINYGNDLNTHLISSARVENGELIITDTELSFVGEYLQANTDNHIYVSVKNLSQIQVENTTANLFINNGHFTINTQDILIEELLWNQTEDLHFVISSEIDMYPGATFTCILKFDNRENFYQELDFDIQFGTPSVNSPLGPDKFGYVIYDINDDNTPGQIAYQWIEIAPNYGGLGSLLDIYDPESFGEGDGVGSNSTETIDLPFQFSFYGESFSQITVCSNGFISFGENSNGEFRNWRLPGALGPNGMIAAFWDDLHMDSNSGIYSYYDNDEDYLVIQWEQMINGAPGHPDEETFQIILYDPQRYPSSLNQGNAKIQYKVFNNVDTGNEGGFTPWHGNYASIGIESPSGMDGLEYTFNNNYSPQASILESNRALYITTKPTIPLEANISIAEIRTFDENNNGIFEVGEGIKLVVSLSNSAINPLTNPHARITSTNPSIQIINDNSIYDDIIYHEYSYGRNYFKFKLLEEVEPGAYINFDLNIYGDDDYHVVKKINIEVLKPSCSLKSSFINDFSTTGNNNYIMEPGERIQLAWEIENTSSVDDFFDTVSIETTSPYLTLITDTMTDIKVKANSTWQGVFIADVSPTAPVNEFLPLTVTANKNGEIDLQRTSSIGLNSQNTAIDFETENTLLNYTDPWEIGTSTYCSAHTGTNVLATTLNAAYPNDVSSTVWTEYSTAANDLILKFWHRYDTEQIYDGGHVIMNIECTSNSILLVPENNYPVANVFALGAPGYSGLLNDWTPVTFLVPEAYFGRSVRFGFRFASDLGVNNQGWFIDDISIGGTIQENFIFSGNVELIDSEDTASAVDITLANYSLNPNINGDYLALLPMSDYEVSYNLLGHRADNYQLTNPNSNSLISYDVSLNYLKQPENLSYSLQDSTLVLNWDYQEDSDDQLTNFILERKFNTGDWEEMAQFTDYQYSCLLNKIGFYSYRLKALYQSDYSNSSNIIGFDYLSGTDNEDNDVALLTSLQANYPNPFNPETNIAYTLAKASPIRLNIFNIKGQLVKTLVNEYQNSGSHKTVWNGKNNQNKAVASGVYLIRIETDDYQKIQKAILMK